MPAFLTTSVAGIPLTQDQVTLLAALYLDHLLGRYSRSIDDLCKCDNSLDAISLSESMEVLLEYGLIEIDTHTGQRRDISLLGLEWMMNEGPDKSLLTYKIVKLARTVLDGVPMSVDRYRPDPQSASVIAATTGVDIVESESALAFLAREKLVTVDEQARFSCNYYNCHDFKSASNRGERSKYFQELKHAHPNTRGLKLEAYLGQALNEQGIDVEIGASRQSEQNDLIAYVDTTTYLCECKWQQNRVDARQMRDLESKVNRRPNTYGAFFSVSGFAKTVPDLIREVAKSSPVLLFGPLETESVLIGRVSFVELAEWKRRELVRDLIPHYQ